MSRHRIRSFSYQEKFANDPAQKEPIFLQIHSAFFLIYSEIAFAASNICSSLFKSFLSIDEVRVFYDFVSKSDANIFGSPKINISSKVLG